MKKVQKILVAMLAIALGVMLVVPAFAVEPRIKLTKCSKCGGAATVTTTTSEGHPEQLTDGTWVMAYEHHVYTSCTVCGYVDDFMYTTHE